MPYHQDTEQTRTSQPATLDRCDCCDSPIPADDCEICPYCGRAVPQLPDDLLVCGYCRNEYPESDGDCPCCGLHPPDDPGDNSALQRARAVIRWHGQARGQTPVNRLMLAYWQAVGHAKELALRGYSERAIAEIQGITKTPVHHRLLKTFSLIRSEIRRITAWLAGPEPIENTDSIGIDRHPPPATVVARYKSIPTRYGWLCYLDRLNTTDGDTLTVLVAHTRGK